jgi:Hydrazine synthase alpha subunit middle domain
MKNRLSSLIIFVGVMILSSACYADLPSGRDVSVQLESLVEADWLSQDGPEAFSLECIDNLVSRAESLAARLRDTADTAKLDRLLSSLKASQEELAAVRNAKDVPEARRKMLYLQVRKTFRKIVFLNPLLTDIDRLLFIKHHKPTGPFHMCDQFYGCNAVAGGGLYVLADPFTPHPKLINLLENAKVEDGRLKGQKLTGGFLSPEISFDGTKILFGHSECKTTDAARKYYDNEATDTYQWTEVCCYHLFQVNADGTSLTQLTDGAYDDFDPCFLPNGRVAFITTRRGGFLRCGRYCPTYTLFSMKPDGTDIVCLSFHETHEWQPSVDNNGMLAYTRWDYVDRNTDIAHHMWTCYPDGRDPRSFHGNYPLRREDRPWMEMDIRAIPDSHKYIATAGAHHGNALGSLVLIDRRKEDDGAMSQLTRLTPDTLFPEAECAHKDIAKFSRYGTPWPLSEKDFLCVYDKNAKNHGIYWIDADGNKELIYRDPKIRCMSPMPFAARDVPPLIPDQTTQYASSKKPGQEATIAVMNIYDSDFEWPKGTRIKSLRIIQALPKTTHTYKVPRIGIAWQANARAVLGTVPVESDGSVYFEAPVGKAIYFQALDVSGMAVQSMRSATYVHPGERLTCQGCHEPKLQSVYSDTSNAPPKAMLRAPSKISPEPDGSNPINYVRLVQPVLDEHCVGCHKEKGAIDLSGEAKGENGWTRSYHQLAEKYGFYHNSSSGPITQSGSRSIPGRIGAKSSKLLPFLSESHYEVKLSPQELRRITVWLDANSDFYGAYEHTEEQSSGKVVVPALD